MRLGKKTTSFAEARRGRRGFTLVELIVVLTILAILAAIGVASVVGYIRKSRFDQNSQNAVTIYQTAQTALSQKTSNGTIDSWVEDNKELFSTYSGGQITRLDMVFNNSLLRSIDETNEAVNQIVYLTYNPANPDSPSGQVLYSLLTDYFYDKTIFNGTISVEFDISVSSNPYSASGYTYSARVVSAFYSIQNTSSNGWDDTCTKGANPFDGLPNRNAEYRYTKSFVGYYNGTEASIKPQISSVFLPQSQIYDLQGHIISESEDPNAHGFLFNMRNGETLDVSWSIFAESDSGFEDFSEDITIRLSDADTITFDDDETERTDDVVLIIDADALNSFRFVDLDANNQEDCRVVEENVDNTIITRTSYDGVVGIEVRRGNELSGSTYYFPITVTKVEGDGRIGCPTDPVTGNPEAYYEYSLSLDCMMVRSAETYDNGGNNKVSDSLYDSTRLFGINPVNISAMISGSYSYTYSEIENGEEVEKTVSISIPKTFAARAIDDPVYFISISDDGTYRYSVTRTTESFAPMDGESDVDSTGKETTGICVVNTMFGDLKYGDGIERTYSGTSWNLSSENGVSILEGNAIITSFRHLYNIRWINSVTNGNVNYRIVRNLNWYYRCSSTKVVSEVHVYHYVSNNSAGAAFESPADRLGNLQVVSFPALKELKSGQILTSMSRVGGTIYSINNVQMRIASFRNGKDAGYGLICKNSGVIYNIYTNNINIILSNVDDGSYCDYRGNNSFNRLCPDNGVSITSNTGKINGLSNNGSNIVGGLVGYNVGRVGTDDTNVDNDRNVIIMNNCIILAGDYWNVYDYRAGGVIGQNDGTTVNGTNVSTFGTIEVRGTFAVVSGGSSQVGGIIGNNKSNISAHLIVDGRPITDSRFASEFTLPVESHSPGGQLSCVVAGAGYTGGAIGALDGCGFNTAVNKISSSRLNSDRITGAMTFPTLLDSDYQIDVTLPSGSMVLLIGGNDRTVGGAIGRINNGTGDYISIRVYNSGRVVTTDTATMSKSVSCGGAVGEENGSQITTVFVNVTNETGSKIGPYDDGLGPIRSGGAFGFISNAEDSRTILINVTNDGEITARGHGNYQGAGGAVGGISDSSSETPVDFYINVVNSSHSIITGNGLNRGLFAAISDNDYATKISQNIINGFGSGGAIGGMGHKDATVNAVLSTNSVIFVRNYGEITGLYHIGGVIGNAPTTKGRIYSENYGSITGVDYVGGAVGRHAYDHNGTIQSILYSGSVIKGTNFIGGAVGRLTYCNADSVVKTIVRGSSTIEGSCVVGGVCGDLRIIGGSVDHKPNVVLEGDSSEPVLTVKGDDGIGGAIGLMRSAVDNYASVITPNQTSNNKLAININGANCIGGAVGCIRTTNVGANETSINKLLSVSESVLANNVFVDIRVVLNPRSYITGIGENIGGAVGLIVGKIDADPYTTFGGRISVSSSAGTSTSDTALIKGNKYVGGAVGQFYNVVPKLYDDVNNSVYYPDGGIFVDFTSLSWRIESTVAAGVESDVGGAVGCFYGATQKGTNDNKYPITVSLGSTTITSNGFNVGGAIGKNQIRNGVITVNNIAGTISGQCNVGGVIGYNENRFTEANATILASGRIEATGTYPNAVSSNTYTTAEGSNGKGSNVGGAIGCYSFTGNDNPTITSVITATVNGVVYGPGNNVGGAVGYCFSNKNKHLIRNITAVLQGDATVHGADNVGGAIGFSLSHITNVRSNISGTSSVEGSYRVGGAIGWTYALEGKLGANILSQTPENLNPDELDITSLETRLNNNLYKDSGRIASITATISADYALQGVACVGGAVGQSGFKNNNKYSSPALVSVEAIVNSAFLFNPFETGIDFDVVNPIDRTMNVRGNACIGGVIGLVVDGRINSVRLSGTGGTVNTDSRYPCPEISTTGAMLIAAKGNSIGGIIGQIGLYGYSKDPQNVTVSSISASNTLGICIVSMNGSDRIGGWIGSGYGVYGGIGNRLLKDYQNVNTRAVYDVNNVRYVYSGGNYVGGFCGYSRGYRKSNNADNNDKPGLVTWAEINVALYGATITGNTDVGGAFGGVENVRLAGGSITVELNNHTVIGDPSGREICSEAGGAIGYLNTGERFGVPIAVSIDQTSHIRANGGSESSSNTFGVGGAIGRCNAIFGRCRSTSADTGSGKFYDCVGTIAVNSSDPTSIAVYSRYSNVGGVVGVMDSVDMSGYHVDDSTNYWSYANNVTVQSDGNNACVGGFVGRINSLSADLYNCYVYGSGNVTATGTNSYAGGFSGFGILNSKVMQYCYSTMLVNCSGLYSGGFFGYMENGTIKNSYVGGHTYQGAYINNSSNISGTNNVGGFVGGIGGSMAITIQDCYSTASVLGTGSNIGGFIGLASCSGTTKITNNYCTGRINGPYSTEVNPETNETRYVANDTDTFGAFVGAISIGNVNSYSGNQVMRTINVLDFPLIGIRYTTDYSSKIQYVDNTVINNGHNEYTATPFDSTLGSTFSLRSVIGTQHYGDWPIPVSGTDNLADAHVYIKVGVDEEGNPVWADFVNDTYEFDYVPGGVDISDLIKVDLQGELTRDVDYVVSYIRNTRVGTATIVIAAKSGNPHGYQGAIMRTFIINQTDISNARAELDELSHEYTGARIEPSVTVVYNDTILKVGDDYELHYDRDGVIETEGQEGYVFDDDNISIGIMYVYVVGKNDFRGMLRCEQRFEITPIDIGEIDPADISIQVIGADNLYYSEDADGNPVAYTPDVVVRYRGETLRGTSNSAFDPEEESYDFVYSYAEGTNNRAGFATLILTGTAQLGKGDVYTGIRTVPRAFEILPAINTWDTEPSMDGWVYGETPTEPSGKPVYGTLSFGYYRTAACEEEDLIDPTEISGLDAGTYYVKVSAADNPNYTGPEPVILSFEITPADITNVAVASAANTDHPEAEYEYSRRAIRPSITVTLPTMTDPLTEGTDFEVAYSSDWVDSGTYTVNITGIGNYTGTVSCSFTIYRTYTVTFDPNGGSSAPAPRQVRENTPVENPSDPSQESPEIPVYSGHRFDGWCYDATGTRPYDFSEPVTGDLVLYAKWVQIYTIEFVTGEGVDPIPSITVDRGQVTDPDKVPQDPEREGFDFGGWYESGSSVPFDFSSTKIWTNYTLYARWIPKVFTVSFDVVGGESVVAPQQVEYGQSAIRPEDPIWEGHNFDGWYLDGAEEVFDFDTTVTSDITLTAHWTEIPASDG